MPVLIKIPKLDNGVPEWAIMELQGDLEIRSNQTMFEQFIGDLCYNKYGQPILVIGHHILQGKEQKIDKAFAIIEKSRTITGVHLDDQLSQTSNFNQSLSQESNASTITNKTILDSTVTLENKAMQKTEYTVRGIVTRKLVFRSRPKPIIANVPKIQ